MTFLIPGLSSPQGQATEEGKAALSPPSDILTTRPISHDEANAVAQRLVASHFGNTDTEQGRASIPARPDHDDDLLITAYIRQQRAKDEVRQPSPEEASAPAGDGGARTHREFFVKNMRDLIDCVASGNNAGAWLSMALDRFVVRKPPQPSAPTAADAGSGEGWWTFHKVEWRSGVDDGLWLYVNGERLGGVDKHEDGTWAVWQSPASNIAVRWTREAAQAALLSAVRPKGT